MAAELKAVQSKQLVTLIHSRDHLLSSEPLPDEMKDKTASLLREGGVNVILGQRVTNIATGSTSTLTLSNGAQLTAAHVISAISKQAPSSTYLPQDVLDNDGYIKISPSLNFPSDSPNYRRHFAVGDIAAWSGIKRCGAAMHMGHFAAENIHQLMIHHQYQHASGPSLLLSTSESPVSTPDSASANSSSSTTSLADIKPARTLSQHPPMIGLALGNTAISYSSTEGIKWGKDVMQRMFGDDLGWSICWNYLRLGEAPPPPGEVGQISRSHDTIEVEKTRRLSQEIQNAKATVDVENVETPSRELKRDLDIEMQKMTIREANLRKNAEEVVVGVFSAGSA
jgi:NADH dehydrogenase FAD-containing subunit